MCKQFQINDDFYVQNIILLRSVCGWVLYTNEDWWIMSCLIIKFVKVELKYSLGVSDLKIFTELLIGFKSQNKNFET